MSFKLVKFLFVCLVLGGETGHGNSKPKKKGDKCLKNKYGLAKLMN